MKSVVFIIIAVLCTVVGFFGLGSEAGALAGISGIAGIGAGVMMR